MGTSRLAAPLKHGSKARRLVLAAMLCAFGAAAFIPATLAGSALAAATNLVKNGSFEKDSDGDGIPNNWMPNEFVTANDKRVCNQAYAGSCSFKFVGDATYKDIVQYVDFIPGNAGDTITVSLWARSKDIVVGAGIYRVDVRIVHDDESDDTDFVLLDAGTTNWRRTLVSLEATESYDYIIVAIIFDPDSGKAWFDKVKLVRP